MVGKQNVAAGYHEPLSCKKRMKTSKKTRQRQDRIVFVLKIAILTGAIVEAIAGEYIYIACFGIWIALGKIDKFINKPKYYQNINSYLKKIEKPFSFLALTLFIALIFSIMFLGSE